MFPELSLCVNGQESEHHAYESEYSKFDESGSIYESGKISSSVNLVWNNFIHTSWARLLSCPVMGAVHITVWSTISDFISLVSLNWYFPLFSSSIKRAFTNARRGVTMETMTRGGPVCRGCPCLQGRRRNSPSFWNVLMKTSMAFAENNSIQARFWFKSFWTTEMRKVINIFLQFMNSNDGRHVKSKCTCLDLIANLYFTGE